MCRTDPYVIETLVTRRGAATPQFHDESWVPVEYFHIHRCIADVLRTGGVRHRWTPPTRCKWHVTFLGWRGDLLVDGAMGVLFHVDHPCGPLLLLYSVRNSAAVAPVLQPWELGVPPTELVTEFRDARNRPLPPKTAKGFRRIGFYL